MMRASTTFWSAASSDEALPRPFELCENKRRLEEGTPFGLLPDTPRETPLATRVEAREIITRGGGAPQQCFYLDAFKRERREQRLMMAQPDTPSPSSSCINNNKREHSFHSTMFRSLPRLFFARLGLFPLRA